MARVLLDAGETADLLRLLPFQVYVPLAFGPGWAALDLDPSRDNDRQVGQMLLAIRAYDPKRMPSRLSLTLVTPTG